MTYHPLVSVIMPFYDQGDFLVESVQCVQAQDYPNVELIVVDDASATCDARDLLANVSMRSLKIIRNPSNIGTAASRNRAVLESSGELIVPLDSDDLVESSYLTETVPFSADPQVAGVYTDMHLFGDVDEIRSAELTLITMMAGSICPNTFLYKRGLYDELGGYKETMRFGEDREFWIRALNTNRQFKHVRKPLYHYRKHEDGKSRRHRSYRFLNQLKENRALYLEHLEAVLAMREDTTWQVHSEYEKLIAEFHELLANYRRLEDEVSKLRTASQTPISSQIAGKIRTLCTTKLDQVWQIKQFGSKLVRNINRSLG